MYQLYESPFYVLLPLIYLLFDYSFHPTITNNSELLKCFLKSYSMIEVIQHHDLPTITTDTENKCNNIYLIKMLLLKIQKTLFIYHK